MMRYGTQAERIGAQKGAMLATAIPKEVLGITGRQHKMKKHMSKVIKFRRWLPYGGAATNATTINNWDVTASAHLTSEGVTPNADNLSAQDITVTMQQYSCLMMYTDVADDMYEDSLPEAEIDQVGRRMGLVREMIRYGALRGCTNKFYAGGTSRSTVDQTLTLALIRNISKSLQGNRCEFITRILKSSPNYGTSPIEAGMLVFCHTDLENDIREMPGFIPVPNYASGKVAHEAEVGSVDRFRFITSPELKPVIDSGAAVGSTGLVSTGGSNIDVYPVIIVADDAWGDVALRGKESFDAVHIPVGKEDKSDPLSQRGYVGGKFYSAMFVQNDGWMAVAEVGCSDLDGL